MSIQEVSMEQLLDMSVDEFFDELHGRGKNAMVASGIRTIRDLVQHTRASLLAVGGVGAGTVATVRHFLKEAGLSLGMDPAMMACRWSKELPPKPKSTTPQREDVAALGKILDVLSSLDKDTAQWVMEAAARRAFPLIVVDPREEP